MRKGISDVFVYILLLLIALFSGLIVRYMASTLIEDYIARTLALRLLIHGVGLSYNTIYSMPIGFKTDYIASFPSDCSMKCIDCNATQFILPPFNWITKCDCNDSILSQMKFIGLPLYYQLIPGSRVDEYRLTCGSYIVNNIEPVIFFEGREPVSEAIMINLQLHPESELFWSFTDTLKKLFAPNTEFFDREITVFSELPINLNDYAGVRKLIDPSTNDFAELLTRYNNVMTLYRRGYDDFESVSREVLNTTGLTGLLSNVFAHSMNSTGIIDAPGELGLNFSILLKPGLNITLMPDKKTICEYECFKQNSLESNCPGNEWSQVLCFNFSTVEDAVCDTCGSNKFDYEINLNCPGNNCVGNTTIDYDALTYLNIYLGSTDYPITEILLNKTLSQKWPPVPREAFDQISGFRDCNLSLLCTPGNDLEFTINISSNYYIPESDKCVFETAFSRSGNFCSNITVQKFSGCDSQGLYNFTYDTTSQQKLTIGDNPSTTFFGAILSTVASISNPLVGLKSKSLLAREYAVTPFGTCADDDFKVTLTELTKTDVVSKKVTGRGAVKDTSFILSIGNTTSNKFYINLTGAS